jgi:hypothetical protein
MNPEYKEWLSNITSNKNQYKKFEQKKANQSRTRPEDLSSFINGLPGLFENLGEQKESGEKE